MTHSYKTEGSEEVKDSAEFRKEKHAKLETSAYIRPSFIYLLILYIDIHT